MKRLLVVCLAGLALASCANGTDAADTSTTPSRHTTSTRAPHPTVTEPETEPEPPPEPEPPTVVTDPIPPAPAPPAELAPGLAGEYHQVRRIDTSTQEMRVLVLRPDATYDFLISSPGLDLDYDETGIVRTDATSIEFVADTSADPDLGFAGRGVAGWQIGPNPYAPGQILTLRFPDGRGYDADGYDNGSDVYFVAVDRILG